MPSKPSTKTSRRRKAAQQVPLFEEKADPWTVKPSIHPKDAPTAFAGAINYGGTHYLCYRGRTIDKATGKPGLDRLTVAADLSNATGAVPREKVEVAADEPNLDAALRKQSARAIARQEKARRAGQPLA